MKIDLLRFSTIDQKGQCLGLNLEIKFYTFQANLYTLNL